MSWSILLQPLEGVLAVEDARARRSRRTRALYGYSARRPKSRLIAAPPISTGKLQALGVQLLDAQRHLLGRRDEQRAQPDRRRVVLLGGLEDRRDRHLLAEVDDRVAVVREDRVDERLADVVHVAEHRREHDRALRVALDLVEVLLELRDGALHDRRRLQHEGQDQLAGAELVADLLHRRQQHVVERRDGADLLDAARRSSPRRPPSCGAGCGSAAPPRAPCPRSGRPSPSSATSPCGLEVRDEELERVLAAVEDEVVGELALGLADLAVGRDVVRVDHREVQAGLDAVVQEDRVEDRARARRRRRRRRSRRRATS